MKLSRRLLIAVYLGVLVLAHLGCDEMREVADIVPPSSVEVISPVPDEVFEVAMGPEREELETEWKRFYEVHQETFPNWIARFDKKLELNNTTIDDFSLLEWQKAFYKKYINAGEIAIVGDESVEDILLIQAAEAVLVITSKFPELRDRLQMEDGFYMVLLGEAVTTGLQIPEHMGDPNFLNYCSFSAGFGIPGVVGYCAATVTDYTNSDRLRTFVHEFGHAIDREIERLKPEFREQINVAYETALARRQASDEFSTIAIQFGTKAQEYFAEGVAEWFFDIGTDFFTQVHESYEVFEERDPLLYEIMSEWFPKVSLNYCTEELPPFVLCF